MMPTGSTFDSHTDFAILDEVLQRHVTPAPLPALHLK